jgi:hypothetical protein
MDRCHELARFTGKRGQLKLDEVIPFILMFEKRVKK